MNQVRWGIVAPGRIAHAFAKALQTLSQKDTDIILAAVASRNKERAQSFAQEYGFLRSYDSYDALFEDSEVDVVYIASPHSSHAELSLKALTHKKHVVCEKPAAVNAEQVKEVIDEAKKQNRFYLEATWMCFNPTVRQTLSWLDEGKIGELEHIEASFSFRNKPDITNRLFAPELAGGALLDTGIYTVTFAMMAAASKDYNKGTRVALPKKIATVAKVKNGIDEWNTVSLSFTDGTTARLESSVTTESASNSKDAYLYGTEGYIKLPLFWMAQEAQLFLYSDNSAKQVEKIERPFLVNGYEYEIEEAVRCIRQGCIETPLHTHDDTLAICKVLDECRKQWGLSYPCENTKAKEKPMNTSDPSITIYTDGGCHGNPGPGGWASVLLYDGKEQALSGGEANTTNNRMELTAAIKALDFVSQHADLSQRSLAVYSDSQYVKNGITAWIQSWKKNGWRTAAKKPVLNQDLWQKLDQLNTSLNVQWSWVKGHAGIRYNEMCDSLCQTEIAKLEK